jgi:hypothetical protein
VERCVAAGVLGVHVSTVEEKVLQVVHHPIPTGLQQEKYTNKEQVHNS